MYIGDNLSRIWCICTFWNLHRRFETGVLGVISETQSGNISVAVQSDLHTGCTGLHTCTSGSRVSIMAGIMLLLSDFPVIGMRPAGLLLSWVFSTGVWMEVMGCSFLVVWFLDRMWYLSGESHNFILCSLGEWSHIVFVAVGRAKVLGFFLGCWGSFVWFLFVGLSGVVWLGTFLWCRGNGGMCVEL